MERWKWTGFVATIVIVLSIPFYLLKARFLAPAQEEGRLEAATFVGSQKCMDCHKKEYDKWRDSHHDHAMEVAGESTVLGEFNDAVFEMHGVRSRFYRKEGGFFVHTQGPDGRMDDFEVTHTFGWYPLQQYLVPFPGGRLQCLPIAWDVREKKWYHLYSDAPIDPKDWLHWTNAAQNWNGMCAECHSTNLKKNYDIQTDTYQTTWSDIDVGCEACHGPASRHVAWAEMPDMARPHAENFELVVQTSALDSRRLVELCAPCHSRRAALGDYTHAEADLLDSMLPSLLEEGLYYPDGQIRDEVYEYGSFTQSKMYHRNVRCSDCHDVHSIKRIGSGNETCLQCHRADLYDTKEHHFHKNKGEPGQPTRSGDGKVLFEVGTGAICTECHMPGRLYMGIDYRLDHSFRIPQPELSLIIGAPNACHRCHADQTLQWSDETITRWYGPGRRPHYGTVLAAGRRGLPEARKDLIRVAGDLLYPVVVRASALSLLTQYPGDDSLRALELALSDTETLIRRTAVQSIDLLDPEGKTARIAPLLYDPVKAVRMEAASSLAGEPSEGLDSDQRRVFEAALHEYQLAMEYSGDFASSRHNLGNLCAALGRQEDAVRHYLAAIQIDDQFYPAKVNLAMVYNERGENEKAEKLFREVLSLSPDLHEVRYSLGLLLAEMKNYQEAAVQLEKAARAVPERARIHYNLGLLHQSLQRAPEAEAQLLMALEREPDNPEYLYAMADHYLKRGEWKKARSLAERIVLKHPDLSLGHDLLRHIERIAEQEGP
jgi:tetratricopeptide (TPR) repeat protein